VAADARGPLIVAGDRTERRFVALTFDVRESDLPLRVAWPLLVLNAIDWFTANEHDYVSSSPVGRALRLPLPAGVTAARLREPGGHERELKAAAGELVLTPTRTGFHRIAFDGGTQLIAVNLREPTRRSLAPQPRLLLGKRAAPRPVLSASGLAQPPWVLLALGALLLLCAEWITYHRRWTV
jgi:hypothetical protein